MRQHRIANNDGTAKAVDTYHLSGLYAVHKCKNFGSYSITHLPTGFRVSWARTAKVAKLMTTVMVRFAKRAGEDAEFGIMPENSDWEELKLAYDLACSRVEGL
tara:strand:- start:1427 stop:1735 length:309 start_codon:yes stop_codon:yes gene_type:complete